VLSNQFTALNKSLVKLDIRKSTIAIHKLLTQKFAKNRNDFLPPPPSPNPFLIPYYSKLILANANGVTSIGNVALSTTFLILFGKKNDTFGND
jgi:predicted transposase YbfD/YdcC